jgi:hypothetical protein
MLLPLPGEFRMNANRLPPLALLAGSIVTALATTSGYAAIIVADGTACTLANAIIAANSNAVAGGCTAGGGADTIQIPASMNLTGELPPVVSDIAFTGTVGTPTITGDGVHRLFFIGGGPPTLAVSFSNLVLAGGVAHGGNSTFGTNAGGGAGAGAGLGGAMFIYDGTVSVSGVSFTSNNAIGGTASGIVTRGPDNSGSGSGGGGGMFGLGGSGGDFFAAGSIGGSAGFGGGGGGGGDTDNEGGATNGGGGGGGSFGGSGGVAGGALPSAGEFGGGGGGGAGATAASASPSQSGAAGGFGGGGGGGAGAAGTLTNTFVPGAAGAGGFGGGGGGGGSTDINHPGGAGGKGGFGGGGGANGYGTPFVAGAAGGFGGGDSFESGGGGGAGFGGAIFIRSGQLTLVNNQFNTNSSTIGTAAGNGGMAKGGAVFALHIVNNPNGNDQGMPTTLPRVSGCMNTFTGNSASAAGATSRDNADTFGADRVGLVLPVCDRIFADGFGVP